MLVFFTLVAAVIAIMVIVHLAGAGKIPNNSGKYNKK